MKELPKRLQNIIMVNNSENIHDFNIVCTNDIYNKIFQILDELCITLKFSKENFKNPNSSIKIDCIISGLYNKSEVISFLKQLVNEINNSV
jgi:hypothetical protein